MDEQIPPIEQPAPISPTVTNTWKNRKWLLLLFLIIAAVGTGGYTLVRTMTPQIPVAITPPPVTSETTAMPKITDTVSPTIKPTVTYSSTDQTIPFVREGSIYLYQNGSEHLVARATQKSTPDSRHDYIYPFLSPNGKYLAFLAVSEEADSEEGMIFVPEGILSIYNLETKATIKTPYKTTNFYWNFDNELEFQTYATVYVPGGKDIDNQKSSTTFVVYSPTKSQIVRSASFSYSEHDHSHINFPFYRDQKTITFSDNTYYLVDSSTQQKQPLITKDSVSGFAEWSRDGTIATFTKDTNTESGYLSIDTTTMQKYPFVPVNPGGAGGEVSYGIQWYFSKGFVTYCSEQISFIDGHKPLELTHTGGGGCNNELGFVATSPNGEYAFVKFDDRFELHTKNGDRKKITELSPLGKSRFSPKNLIWLNNDYMVIYQSTAAFNIIGDTDNNPSVYLFDRRANTIKAIIPNAYLSTFAAGIP